MIRLLVLDCDGVLTDGGLFYGADGEQLKRFDVRDGLGIRRLAEAGVTTAVVTGRGNAALACRAQELGIATVRMAVGDKAAAIVAIQAELDVTDAETAAMGDDLPDLAMFDHAALRLAPADAEAAVRDAADIVTPRGGGLGAVRDAAELILAQNAAEHAAPDAAQHDGVATPGPEAAQA